MKAQCRLHHEFLVGLVFSLKDEGTEGTEGTEGMGPKAQPHRKVPSCCNVLVLKDAIFILFHREMSQVLSHVSFRKTGPARWSRFKKWSDQWRVVGNVGILWFLQWCNAQYWIQIINFLVSPTQTYLVDRNEKTLFLCLEPEHFSFPLCPSTELQKTWTPAGFFAAARCRERCGEFSRVPTRCLG